MNFQATGGLYEHEHAFGRRSLRECLLLTYLHLRGFRNRLEGFHTISPVRITKVVVHRYHHPLLKLV